MDDQKDNFSIVVSLLHLCGTQRLNLGYNVEKQARERPKPPCQSKYIPS